MAVWKKSRYGGIASAAASAAYKGLSAFSKGRKALKSFRKTSTKKRTKKQRSYQKSKRQKKGKSIIHGDSTGWSSSQAQIIYKKTLISKVYTAISNRSKYETIHTGVMAPGSTGNINQQQISTFGRFLGDQDFLDVVAKMYTNLLAANPLNTGVEPLTNQVNQKFYIDSVTQEFDYVNATESNTLFDIYTLVSKVTKPLYVDPYTDWDNGLYDEKGISTVTPLFPGNKPTQSKAFNTSWKVVCRKRVFLSPGGQHKYQFRFKPQSIVDYDYFKRNQQIRGLTMIHLLVAQGQLGTNTQSFATTAAVNYSPVKIICHGRTVYTTRCLSLLPSHTYQETDVATVTLQNSSTPTNYLWVQNEDTGLPINVLDNDYVG